MNFRNLLWTYAPRKDGSCDIKVYVNAHGQKKYFSTGLRVMPKDWDEKKGQVKRSHPLAELYNSKIARLRLGLEDHLLKGGTIGNFVANEKDAHKHSLIEFGNQFLEEVEKGIHDDISNATANIYRATLKHLRNYCNHHHLPTLFFQDIDLAFHRNFTAYLLKFGNCELPTVGKHIKNIKKLMNLSYSRKLHQNLNHREKGFKTYREGDSTKIYLTEEEINCLSKIDLSSQPYLEKERDRFLVAYFFLLRFSDVIRINRQKFFELRDRFYLRTKHFKTGTEVVVPVKPKAQELLEQYDYNFNFSTNQEANRHLKRIAAIAGLNDITSEGNRTLPKSQFVCTHTARRSAATNLFLQNVSLGIIAKLGGWKTSESLRKYLLASGLDNALFAKDLDFFS